MHYQKANLLSKGELRSRLDGGEKFLYKGVKGVSHIYKGPSSYIWVTPRGHKYPLDWSWNILHKLYLYPDSQPTRQRKPLL